MGRLDDMRSIDIRVDRASDWLPDIRLHAGDIKGRLIRLTLTDAQQPVDAMGLTARLLFNTRPDDPASTGGWVTMVPVPGQATATWNSPVPRAALTAARCRIGVEITDTDGSVVCSRGMDALVEPSILRMDNKDGADALEELHTCLAGMDQASDRANQAAQRADTSTANADRATNQANSAAQEARDNSAKAGTATGKALAAAQTAADSAQATNQATDRANQAAAGCDTAASDARQAASEARDVVAGTLATADEPGRVKPGKAMSVDQDGAISPLGLPVYILTDQDAPAPTTPCIIEVIDDQGVYQGTWYDDGKA